MRSAGPAVAGIYVGRGARCGEARLQLFFFSSRRRHTRSLCDWSSDVCSSDLADQTVNEDAGAQTAAAWATLVKADPVNENGQTLTFSVTDNTNAALFAAGPAISATTGDLKIGRASCRERAENSVVAGPLTKKK